MLYPHKSENICSRKKKDRNPAVKRLPLTAGFFAQFYECVHIVCQVLAPVPDEIQFSCQRLRKRDHLYGMFLNVFPDQKAGQDSNSQPFCNAPDDRLGAGALPERMHGDLFQGEACVQDLAPCASLLPHKEGILCELF